MKIPIKLPRYTVMQPRPSGKTDFHFRPPKKAILKGWSKQIRLPIAEADRTRDGSASELAAVERDAERLLKRLEADLTVVTFPAGSLPDLFQRWTESAHWEGMAPKTQTHYRQGWEHINKWSARNAHPNASKVSWPVIIKLMGVYANRPGVHRQVRQTLTMLLRRAEDEGSIQESPFRGRERYRWHLKESDYAVEIWNIAHVEAAVRICDQSDNQHIGTAILIGFDLMQYPSQIASFRRGEHYDPSTGEFLYNRNKTGVPARVRVSERLRERLKGCGLYLISRPHKGALKPVTGEYLAKKFRALMKASDIPDLRTFQMRWLRHSGVFEARKAGLDMETIADIGAWKSTGAVQAVIDKHYRVPDGELASAGMARREAFRKEGTSSEQKV